MATREKQYVDLKSLQQNPTITACQWQTLKTYPHRKTEEDHRHSNTLHPHSNQEVKEHHRSNNLQEVKEHHCGNVPQLPRSRHKHSACCEGEYIFLFGGKDGTSPLKDVWRLHVQTGSWEVVQLRGCSLPLLQGHSTVAYKRVMIIYGGTFSNSVGDTQLWTYNTDLGHLRDVWIEPGTPQPLCRREHSAVVYNNFMYVYGGFVDARGASHELWAFNIDEEEWVDVSGGRGAKPGARYGHSAVTALNAMWVYGGMAGLEPRADLWKFSFSLQQWRKVKGLGSPPSLSGHAATVIHNQMVLVGGSCQGKPSRETWMFRFDTSSWQLLTSSGVTQLPGLTFHACLTFDPRPWNSGGVTRSTPHLKPAVAQRITEDLFQVRPRSSPASVQDAPNRPSRSSGVTQVMTLGSEVGVGGHTNSCNKMDARIYVDDEEPLVPPSPDMVCFHNSCIPFESRGSNKYAPLEDVSSLSQETSHCQQRLASSGSNPERLSQGAPSISSQKDLIDFSQSPVLKPCRPSLKEQSEPFGSDLFVEDLDGADLKVLEGVRISYPSQNPFFPFPASSGKQRVWAGDCDGELWQSGHKCGLAGTSHVSQAWKTPPQSNKTQKPWTSSDFKWNQDFQSNCQTRSCVNGTSNSIHCTNVPDNPRHRCHSQVHSNASMTSQKLFHAADKESALISSSSSSSSSHSENQRQALAYSQALQAENRQSMTDDGDCMELHRLSVPSVCVTGCFQESGDSLADSLPCHHTRANVTSQFETPFQGSGCSDSDELIDINKGCVSEFSRDWNIQGGEESTSGERIRQGGEDTAPGERISQGFEETISGDMEGSVAEPFLLVLGGRTEEHGSVHPKPIAVWKGMLL